MVKKLINIFKTPAAEFALSHSTTTEPNLWAIISPRPSRLINNLRESVECSVASCYETPKRHQI